MVEGLHLLCGGSTAEQNEPEPLIQGFYGAISCAAGWSKHH